MSSSKLFVGCLPFSKTESELYALFGKFGQVTEVALLRNPDGSPKGAAFVTFANAQSASKATMHLQGHVFQGSTRGINVSVAGGKGGGGGGKGGGGGGAISAWGGGGKGGCGGKGSFPQQSYYQKGFPSKSMQPPSKNNWQPSQNQWQASSQQDIPGAKCFVAKLPFSRSERDLVQLFSSCGPVEEVVLLTDKQTGEKKGAAFVRFATPQHAAGAVTALNGFTFHGSTRPISVEIAQGKIDTALGTTANGLGKRPSSGMGAYVGVGCKLFVGQLPFSKSEGAIKEVFQTYGSVVEVALLRNASGEKTGGAFVSFEDPENAASALELNGYTFPGATRPITVSLATKRQRTQ